MKKPFEGTMGGKKEVSEKIIERASKLLDKIASMNDPEARIDEQCQKRFGMNWDEVRRKIQERVANGFELFPVPKNEQGVPKSNVTVSPEMLIKGIGNSTGNWMTNNFLQALYLSYSKAGFVKESSMERLVKNIDLVDCSPQEYAQAGWDLLDIAPDILPEKVRQVLSSYGLAIQKGHRMKATAIDMDTGTSRRIEIE